MTSPVNRISCHDVFSLLSFIYFAHYRVRVTIKIPPLGLSRCSLMAIAPPQLGLDTGVTAN